MEPLDKPLLSIIFLCMEGKSWPCGDVRVMSH